MFNSFEGQDTCIRKSVKIIDSHYYLQENIFEQVKEIFRKIREILMQKFWCSLVKMLENI